MNKLIRLRIIQIDLVFNRFYKKGLTSFENQRRATTLRNFKGILSFGIKSVVLLSDDID